MKVLFDDEKHEVEIILPHNIEEWYKKHDITVYVKKTPRMGHIFHARIVGWDEVTYLGTANEPFSISMEKLKKRIQNFYQMEEKTWL